MNSINIKPVNFLYEHLIRKRQIIVYVLLQEGLIFVNNHKEFCRDLQNGIPEDMDLELVHISNSVIKELEI
jgi:hypothetical protein